MIIHGINCPDGNIKITEEGYIQTYALIKIDKISLYSNTYSCSKCNHTIPKTDYLIYKSILSLIQIINPRITLLEEARKELKERENLISEKQYEIDSLKEALNTILEK